jgi:hypothetical protein
MLPCPIHKLTGFDCPGCGMQRAAMELLNGNICKSILYYPALLPLILMFVFLSIYLIFKIKNGAKILKYLFIFNAIIIFVNYIIKFIKI